MLNADLASFTYSSQPHAAPVRVTAKQPRYRDPNDLPLTLMSDPRVVRGSTHSLARKITVSKNELTKSQHAISKKGIVVHEPPSQPMYKFTVKPFSNEEIDVSTYLVQQTDYRPQKKTLESQTDVFLPRPDTPEYVPAKVGIDTGTQVENDNYLFDFDVEVAPIVEVITQKTIDQALFELSSEEELTNLENTARNFRTEKFRSEEWMRNRENQAIGENKQRRERIQTLQTARENEKHTKTAIAGIQMMRQTFQHAFHSACNDLNKRGVWQEIDAAIAEKEFIPLTVERSREVMAAYTVANEVLDEILLGTEALYQTFPSYGGPRNQRSMAIVLTFRRAPAESEDASVEASNGANVQQRPTDVTVMTIQVGPRDTIDTINRRIRNEVSRLKLLAERAAAGSEDMPAAEENDKVESSSAETPVVPSEDLPSVNTVLPDAAALAPLRSHLYEALAQSLSRELMVSTSASVSGDTPNILRDLAYDATLLNFPFPDFVKFDMIV